MLRILLLFPFFLSAFVSGFASSSSCSLQSGSYGSGAPVTTINASGSTGFDVTRDSNSYNYTLYQGNPSLWGNLQPGGYVEFTVSAPTAGTYSLQAYYSSAPGAGANLSVNGSQQSPLNLVSTGSWGNLVLSPQANIYLPSGQSVIQIAAQGNFQPFNLAGLLITPVQGSSPVEQSPTAQPAPQASPTATNVNSNGVTGFNIASASNFGGYTLYPGSPSLWGNLQPGGFVEYTVNAQAGNYAIQLFYATAMNSGASITVNGSQQQGATFPSTGSWGNYQMNSPLTLSLPSGTSVIRIAAQNPFAAFNLQGMTLTSVSPSSSGGGNPLANTGFYVNPYSEAAQNIGNQCWGFPNTSGISKIAQQPQGVWFGDWNSNVQSDVAVVINSASSQGQVPVLVAYDIPIRDCSGYSGGGATSAGVYQSWIQAFAAGIGGAKAVVILEPDALLQIYSSDCLTSYQQSERYQLLNFAVGTLHTVAPNALVYIDAGRAGEWEIDPSDMAQRLQYAGVANAAGFSLNVSNYIATDVTTTYGQQISSMTGNKHFVIDTSRNGLGSDGDLNWCNPPGRGLGAPPQGLASGLTDAYLWVQNPGTSDGTCNGGPPAGQFSVQIACTLANNAIF
ncbi:MAG: glycoside hydrolase family 6 protein [Acidobacteriaceae bacterium]